MKEKSRRRSRKGGGRVRTIHASTWVGASLICADGDVGEDAGLVDTVAVLVGGGTVYRYYGSGVTGFLMMLARCCMSCGWKGLTTHAGIWEA